MSETNLETLQSQAVKTADPRLSVKVSPNAPLPVGEHAFQLVVTDNAGNESQATQVRLVVRDTQAPTAVIRALGANGRPLAGNTVPFGASFILTGEKSTDLPPGRIVAFEWTLLD